MKRKELKVESSKLKLVRNQKLKEEEETILNKKSIKSVVVVSFFLILLFTAVLEVQAVEEVKKIEISTLIQLESRVWDALKSGDIKEDSRLLSDEFLGVYDTGFAGKEDHINQLSDGPTVHAYRIENPKMIILSSDTALLSYKAVWSRIKMGIKGKQEVVYISSIWKLTKGKWINIFSQDTKKSSEEF